MSLMEWFDCLRVALNEFDPHTGRTVGGTLFVGTLFLSFVGFVIYGACRLISSARGPK
jgi:hypothetical protein